MSWNTKTVFAETPFSDLTN